jgi:Putative MetA-pathway of phenol degradation
MQIGARALASLGIWLAASAAAPVQAQSASSPDKSQYWLANPVPTDQMRDFNTDRPTKANIPYTVDAGHFQYETDIVNFATLATGPININTLLVPNPTFKLGLTNNIDFEVNAPTVVGVHTFNAATITSSTMWGVNDVFIRAKVNLWGDDGGKSALALIPYVKAPTAPLGIGNGATEEGLIVPFSLSLPDNFTLLFNSEIDAFKDIADNGRHANFVNLVNLSRTVVKDVTMYVELWSDYNNDPTQRTTQLSFDVAFAWVVRPNLQVDVGADVGLTTTTPAIQVVAGISQRF